MTEPEHQEMRNEARATLHFGMASGEGSAGAHVLRCRHVMAGRAGSGKHDTCHVVLLSKSRSMAHGNLPTSSEKTAGCETGKIHTNSTFRHAYALDLRSVPE